MATVKPRLSLNENFILRGQSYKAGMLLLVSHLTEQEWKLGNKFSARTDLISEQIDRLYKDYENDLKKDKGICFKAANVKFKSLIASYISILVFHTTLKNSFQSLCVAERCAVWHKGHEKFDTLVSFVSKDSQLASLEIAQSETPCTGNDILLQEYRAEPKPFWFKSLPKWLQNFIKKNAEKLFGPIPSSLRNIPGLANLSMHSFKINDVEVLRNFRHATPAPIDLMAKQPSDELVRLICLNVASQLKLSLATGSLNQQELVILLLSLLSPGWAATLKANYFTDTSDNDTLLYEMKERIVELFQRALSNPNKQIDAKDAKIIALFFTEEEQLETLYYKDFLAKFDLRVNSDGCIKYKQHKPVKITLLSTNRPLNILRRFGVHPDQTKRNDFNTARLLNAVGRYLSPLLFEKNSTHPPEQFPALLKYIEESERSGEKYSTLRKLISQLDLYGRNKNFSVKKGKKELIKTIEDLLKKDSLDKSVGLKQENKFDRNTVRLLDALQALLAIPTRQGVLTADTRHHQMLISSLEMVILNRIGGIPWVACKSGKDRTAGALIAADAMEAFYKLKGRHPRHDDNKQDRALLLELYEYFFESGHHQQVASKNAPGAEGLIKFSNFAPNDLVLDQKKIQSETKFARLNKPINIKNSHNEPFNQQILKDELRSLKDKTIKVAIGQNVTLGDFSRNWNIYSINGVSVKKLRNGKEFKDENDLSEFIETQLLGQIKDQELKKYYLTLALGSFHQGGFLHAFSLVSGGLINNYYQQEKQNTIIGQPNMKINLSWVKGKGIQIEEINAYKEKKHLDWDDPSEKGDFCETHSCILLNLNTVKDKGYKLAVNIQSVYVNCTETQLKSVFFSKKTLLEAFIDFLQSLLVAIKRCFDKLIKPYPILDEGWISKTNATFFKKSTETTVNEASNALQCEPSAAPVFLS
ncbi:hypothetical protein [Rickettsiella endosymbiont of Rhagonycha lignosa]|uniref:hypothetical protein n=1 Tax=Rickettsiella endosymbiont of Rhagonycha lignosa TaxID=3077937 RepID=UPI00313B0C25